VAIWHNDDVRGLNEKEDLDTEKGRSETKPNRQKKKRWCGGRAHRNTIPLGYISKTVVGFDAKVFTAVEVREKSKKYEF
jgi:hypothetical protein